LIGHTPGFFGSETPASRLSAHDIDIFREGDYTVITSIELVSTFPVRMNTTKKTRIVRIGNSRGIRIPSLFIEQSGLSDDVELELQPNRIVIRPSRRAREGWDAQFAAMHEKGDDRLLDDEVSATKWDEEEWEW